MTAPFLSVKPTKQAKEFFALLQNPDNDLSDIRVYLPDGTSFFSRCKPLRTNNAYLDRLIRTSLSDIVHLPDGQKELFIKEDCSCNHLKALFKCFTYPGEFRHTIRISNQRTTVSYSSLIDACKFVTLIDKWAINHFETKSNDILSAVKRRIKEYNAAWITYRRLVIGDKLITSKEPLPINDIEPIKTDMYHFWTSYFPSSHDIDFFILINASPDDPCVSRAVYERLTAPDAFHIYLESLQTQEIIERIFFNTLFNIKKPNIIYKAVQEHTDNSSSEK